ncbi:hypothetical protein B0T24DRAFT_413626 [Lasiosphaeria ovina]|uniref:Uncharacterized protein n=1 Tax=Lasiosphaeria ovina TaxID=92902 RepID=A0AAE0JY14_9PEZI|nr:hypothetical protein B0T24DRAFT_413626 [Lasiosphaeria ovina]
MAMQNDEMDARKARSIDDEVPEHPREQQNYPQISNNAESGHNHIQDQEELRQSCDSSQARPDQDGVMRRHRWTRGLGTAAQTAALVAFVLSCVSLWSTITSASDARLSALLAQWTSLKDFLEYCESVSVMLQTPWSSTEDSS